MAVSGTSCWLVGYLVGWLVACLLGWLVKWQSVAEVQQISRGLNSCIYVLLIYYKSTRLHLLRNEISNETNNLIWADQSGGATPPKMRNITILVLINTLKYQIY